MGGTANDERTYVECVIDESQGCSEPAEGLSLPLEFAVVLVWCLRKGQVYDLEKDMCGKTRKVERGA